MNYYYKDRNWIYFGFDYNKELVYQLKCLGCKYNIANKEWYVFAHPATMLNVIDLIKEYDFKEINPNQIKRSDDIYLKPFKEMLSKDDITTFLPDLNLKKQLRTYQIDTLQYMINRGNCINGSSCGTGKTLTTIVEIEFLDLFPCLIVCPNSVKRGWEREWNETNPDRTLSVISSNNKKNNFTADVIVINYDLLGKKDGKGVQCKYPEIEDIKFNSIVADEIHFLKNANSIRSRIFLKISKEIPMVIGLSGTLIMNRPSELINILNIIRKKKEIAPNMFYFEERYCNRKLTPFGKDLKGAVNINELHKLLSHYCYYRIEKRDALKELPPTQEQYIEISIDNKKIYKAAEKDIIEFLTEAESIEKVDKALKAKQLVEIDYLMKLSLDGKKKGIKEFIEDWLESNEEEKLIVFGVHKELLQDLNKLFKDSLLITGDTREKDREQFLNEFKTDPSKRLLFANIQCLGTGVDGLQKVCSCMALTEFPSRPSDLIQVISRLERSEQKNSVNVYYLLSKDTIDQKLWKMLKEKKEITDIVNKGYIDDTSLMLISSLKQRPK